MAGTRAELAKSSCLQLVLLVLLTCASLWQRNSCETYHSRLGFNLAGRGIDHLIGTLNNLDKYTDSLLDLPFVKEAFEGCMTAFEQPTGKNEGLLFVAVRVLGVGLVSAGLLLPAFNLQPTNHYNPQATKFR